MPAANDSSLEEYNRLAGQPMVDELNANIALLKTMRESAASGAYVQLPQFQCHKKVWALKIKRVIPDSKLAIVDSNRETDGGAIIVPEEPGYAPFKADMEYIRKHKPEAGGYYVVYEDGYKSFSPAKAFESGYTKLETPEAAPV